ncbi:stage V sporulation protein AB [Paenibacillus swuensis]|uniref:Stage V sporulation protein AB n=1 Tax=Paenibacillus swuensis TaxID=1178515 RepID=A0A172TMG1_9BACL|nr:stage V sporulation protein AB [Paenibacillus swuensis]ANE48017.1 stage V sporulation protein AB [Paenibacillus swuensis]
MTLVELGRSLFVILLGLAGGIAVGSGTVAFLIVLDIIPRLAQLTRSYHQSQWMEAAVISGSVLWSFADFFDWKLGASPLLLTVVGLFTGVFVGLLAAALTEVLNVLPILAKRLRMMHYMVWLLMAMVFGKIFGSLFDWLIYHQ